MSDDEKAPLSVRLPPATVAKVREHIVAVAKKTGLKVSFPAMMDSLLLLGLASPEAKALAGEK